MGRAAVLSIAPVVAALLGGGCAGPNLAEHVASAPAFEPEGQTKCGVRRSHDKPLVVEWPSADRAELEARAKTQVVVVRYDGCEMEVLSHCRAPGAYRYTPVSPKQDTVSIRNLDELYAQIPVGAASLEGKLERAGQLTVAMTMVGRLDAERVAVGSDELEGACRGATHVMTGMTLGAFEFYAGAEAEVGAKVGVAAGGKTIGAGGRSASQRETITRDGTPAACGVADDVSPPADCSAPLRVEVVPLGLPTRRAATCPDASEWNGRECVRTEVVTETVTETVCPDGAHWDGSRCVAPVATSPVRAPPSDATALLSMDTLRGDEHPGEGWYCFVGDHEGRRFGLCERDQIECGMAMGKKIEAGLSTEAQRCEPQPDAACFQVQRTLEEGLRTFCFPEPGLCTTAHAGVARRKDVQELTDCQIYR